MVRLDVERINIKAPYRVKTANASNVYKFETAYGVQYSICFTEEIVLQSTKTYQFSIVNLNGKKSPRDSKLRITIMEIVAEFFEKNNATILYICDTADRKQQMRSRLFESWFKSYVGNFKYAIFTATIIDEGIPNYASIILRTDNPEYNNIVAEFTETIQLLSNKPS